MVLYFTQRWIFGPLIPSFMEAFGADRTALGVVGAGSLWGYMFTPIIAGMLSDRFGRKYTVLFGIFGFGDRYRVSTGLLAICVPCVFLACGFAAK